MLVRRLAVLAVLMFWQGGFTFYCAVVVPVGRNLDRIHQSFVTQRVTNYLNVAGAIAIPVLFWEGVASTDPSTRRRRWRWLSVAVLAIGLGALVLLHWQLDAFMHSGVVTPEAIQAMWPWHIAYLWVSTLQWVVAVGYMVMTMLAWRAEDQRS